MINASVLVQDVTLDSMRFVLSMCRDGVAVKYLIVAPSAVMHPKRQEQIKIKQQVFGNSHGAQGGLRRWVVALLGVTGMKQNIAFVLASIIGFLKGFKVCSFQDRKSVV